MPHLHGLVLAAGAGRRLGRPKALMRDAEGTPWVALAAQTLEAAGCTEVTVVLGASAERARELVPADALVAVAADWELGMSASLRAGLAALTSTDADAALVTLVDLPGMPVSVARRVLARPGAAPPVLAPPVLAPENSGHLGTALRQAVFDGRPGHPVLIGRTHWPELSESLSGDRGARPYLVAHGAAEVECGDLWDGHDVDVLPPLLR